MDKSNINVLPPPPVEHETLTVIPDIVVNDPVGNILGRVHTDALDHDARVRKPRPIDRREEMYGSGAHAVYTG
jgi:hypothetical protein